MPTTSFRSKIYQPTQIDIEPFKYIIGARVFVQNAQNLCMYSHIAISNKCQVLQKTNVKPVISLFIPIIKVIANG